MSKSINANPGAHQIHTSVNPPSEAPLVKLEISEGRPILLDPNYVVHMNKSLVSRATMVVDAAGEFPEADEVKLVAKISWLNKKRQNEVEIMRHTRSCGKDISNYPARVFGYYEVNEDASETSSKLGLGDSFLRPARAMRILIPKGLNPIAEVQGQQLFSAWAHCVGVYERSRKELDTPPPIRDTSRSSSRLDEAVIVEEWLADNVEMAYRLVDTAKGLRGMSAVGLEAQVQLLDAFLRNYRAKDQQEDNIELLDIAIACERQALELSEKMQCPIVERLRSLGALLYERFSRLGVIIDIDDAIENETRAVKLTPDGHPNQPDCLNSLGISWQSRFKRLGELADLDHAICCQSGAVDLTPDGHPDKPARLNNLGVSWLRRFERLGELGDLDHAIECKSGAVDLTPDGHPDKPGYLNNLGNSWLCRFERLGELGDLDHAIGCQSGALDLTPDGHPDKPGRLNNLGISLQSRFKRLGELGDLDHAIECKSGAVDLTPDGHPDKPARLNNLGSSWQSRFERLGELGDLDHAIECKSGAVDLTPDGHPDKPGRLSNLGISWLCRFERLGELGDLDHAIECKSGAVDLTPDGHPNKPACLSNLGNSWLRRFERFGELGDLDHAIGCQSGAVDLTPDGHPDKPRRLSNLGNSWQSRFERLGELGDLDYAIGCQSSAVGLTPDGHPDKPARLSNLGNSWLRRFERLGELGDLDHAIECKSGAVDLTPDGHPNKPGFLSNLGISWQSRFKRLGELGDLDHAIECKSGAVDLTPDGHPDKPGRLSNLGNSWRSRFERLRELGDLDHAIGCQSGALDLTPDGHPDKPGYLSTLGNSWLRRFERLGELGDLDHAIGCQSSAVDLTPDDHPNKPACLNNLGNSWLCRFERLGELGDLDHAIGYQSGALDLIPDGHPDKPACLNNLGNSWLRRFERFGELGDLDHAIEYQSGAVDLTPDGHPDKPAYLNNLGNSWQSRFLSMRQVVDLENACNAYKTGATVTAFKPHIQMNCARQWATISRDLQASPLEAYRVAFSLLPRLVWIGQTIHHRQEAMINVRDLAAEAAAWAVSVHLYDLALEWLEQGRSVVWGQTLKLRTPFDELSSADPELAQKLQYTASQLDIAGSGPASQLQDTSAFPDLLSQAAHHHRLASDWDKLLAQARLLPGFEKFMQPLESKELKRAAKDGPVVVINTYRTQCDALIISPNCDDIMHAGNSNAYELPHLTWCTAGAMSFLPLHAAGLCDGSPNVCSIVVSSYAPTLTSLLLHKTLSHTQVGLAAVGPEASLTRTTLPKTVDELKIISEYKAIAPYLQLEGASATVDATLTAMEESSWVHLACHAVQNRLNPSQSAFHLYDGELTLEEIARRQFKNKGLAFLSACQTATGDRGLPDEATHLAAGMLMAGYPSVIGTMWSIMDEDAPLVADVVYSELLKDGKLDHTMSARALHEAVKALREKVGEKEIRRWAPFIHMGV
ncbi:CHAT domain protein [Ceratobasidium sp. AG-Ba]|nr:CHAT domain protein [Ceratobasidium sp. AG-Ba]